MGHRFVFLLWGGSLLIQVTDLRNNSLLANVLKFIIAVSNTTAITDKDNCNYLFICNCT